jgi:hypothetical protein
MDCVEELASEMPATANMPREAFESVHLMKLKRVVRLRLDVHADDLKPSHPVAPRAATRATEQVEQTRP